MKSLFYDKRGSVPDSIYVPAYILTMAMVTFIALFVWFSFQTNFSTVIAHTSSNTTITNVMNEIRDSLLMIDYMFPFLVGGMLIVSLILAFRTGASVVYAFVSIILWGFALLMSAVFTNVFGEFQKTFPTVATQMPIIVTIMDNMKWIVLAWVFLISAVMFTRTKREDEGLRQGIESYYSGGTVG